VKAIAEFTRIKASKAGCNGRCRERDMMGQLTE
jgi:hypothetical protein